MTVEVLVAILVSALALLVLPRRRLRQYLATASTLGRLQYGLLLVPSIVFAALLWADLWAGSLGHSGSSRFNVIIVAIALWGVVLAATRLPEIMSGRASRTPPTGSEFRDIPYPVVLAAAPFMVGAAFLVTLAFAASLLSGRGGPYSQLFVALAAAAGLAVLLAFIVVLIVWTKLLLRRWLRPTHRGTHHTRRE
ncbi:MAG TPA: hypothetical protein VLR46_00400 [Candidatus Dormibacteraeota bacterium]|nr:hypothetical protein [Candidatus Dormibacteraeota bacterium]